MRNMKKRRHFFSVLFVFLILAAGVFMLAVGACIGGGKYDPNEKPRHMTHEVGVSLKELSRMYGKPSQTSFLAKEPSGELQKSVRAKIANNDTQVLELTFQDHQFTRIYWLTEQSAGDWRVVDGVLIRLSNALGQ
jgi:hypothetical protein